jgi:hypothetical protein
VIAALVAEDIALIVGATTGALTLGSPRWSFSSAGE